jgi:hypothetical protein
MKHPPLYKALQRLFFFFRGDEMLLLCSGVVMHVARNGVVVCRKIPRDCANFCFVFLLYQNIFLLSPGNPVIR